MTGTLLGPAGTPFFTFPRLYGASFSTLLPFFLGAGIRMASRAWLGTVLLTALGTAATFFVRPDLLANFAARPWGDALPVVAVGGLSMVRRFNASGRDGSGLIASGVFLAGMLASSAFALYPDVLPAAVAANSLTVNNAAAPQYGLAVGLV